MLAFILGSLNKIPPKKDREGGGKGMRLLTFSPQKERGNTPSKNDRRTIRKIGGWEISLQSGLIIRVSRKHYGNKSIGNIQIVDSISTRICMHNISSIWSIPRHTAQRPKTRGVLVSYFFFVARSITIVMSIYCLSSAPFSSIRRRSKPSNHQLSTGGIVVSIACISL